MSNKGPTMECRSCHRVKVTYGRGLCSGCYQRHHRSGTIVNFEPLNVHVIGTSARPSKTCPWCNIVHRSYVGDACVECRNSLRGLDLPPHPDDALVGGAWVTVHGVRRWVPDTNHQTRKANAA